MNLIFFIIISKQIQGGICRMNNIEMVIEQTPIHITHNTYKRECKYTRGLHIPLEEFQSILAQMCPDTKVYFEFHNMAKPIMKGTYLNGHSGLAKEISKFYQNERNVEVPGLNDGKDFYVKII